MTLPYLSLTDYYKSRYDYRVQRIAVTLDFTCPNLDGTISTGGCIYCDDGTIPCINTRGVSLEEQIETGMAKAARKYGDAVQFMIYFQTNTNTYAPLHELKKIYDTPLKYKNVMGIVIGTRPDCFDRSTAALVETYIGKYREVWVELGLQSSRNETLEKINRGHTLDDFLKAAKLVKSIGAKLVAHMIVGFPWENAKDAMRTAMIIKTIGADGIKIHPLHIIQGTKLAKMHEKKNYKLLTEEEYVKIVADIINKLPDDMIIMRFTADTDNNKLIAPAYCKPEQREKIKQAIIAELCRDRA